MRDDVRHRLPEDRVDEKDQADDDQRDADGPAGGVEQQHDADAAEDRLHRNAVPDVKHSLAGDQAVPAEEQVDGRKPAEQGTGDVVDGQAMRTPPARKRKYQEAQQQGEGQVDAAGADVADDGEVQHEREGGGDPELVDRPREAECADQLGQPGPLAAALVLDLLEALVNLRGRARRV